MSTSTNVVVLDNGGGLIKAGMGGERDPAAVVPNCVYRAASSKKWGHPNLGESDLTSAAVRRPMDRGYLINPELEREIWSHLFSSILHITPSQSALLLTEPLFTLPSIQRSLDQLVFEDFNFRSLYVAHPPSLVHLHEASLRPNGLLSKAQCSLVVDSGFSFTHASPVFHNFPLNYASRRIDIGGKALTNYLKDLVSFRSVNLMDETFLIDHLKESLCFVSLDLPRDLRIAAASSGHDNLFRCTYVLPDGLTHTKGFLKYPHQARRYLALTDPSLPSSPPPQGDIISPHQKAHFTKNEFDLTNERFLVPEIIFRPSDLGMNQAGLAECIVRAVNACHPLLHPVLYESIILTGGNTLFPHFAERLEKELRPLVPDDFHVKITTQEDPILGVWRGGSLLASSPDFEAMCVTKSEYEELGSARCRKRFFQ